MPLRTSRERLLAAGPVGACVRLHVRASCWVLTAAAHSAQFHRDQRRAEACPGRARAVMDSGAKGGSAKARHPRLRRVRHRHGGGRISAARRREVPAGLAGRHPDARMALSPRSSNVSREPRGPDPIAPAELGLVRRPQILRRLRQRDAVSLTMLNLCHIDRSCSDLPRTWRSNWQWRSRTQRRATGIARTFPRSQTELGKPFVDVADLCLSLLDESDIPGLVEKARALGDFVAGSRAGGRR